MKNPFRHDAAEATLDIDHDDRDPEKAADAKSPHVAVDAADSKDSAADDNTVSADVQDGVKKAQAVTIVWDKKQLILAYVLWVSVFPAST